MKTKYDSKVTRTSGWKSQNKFDNLLADLSVSSLRYLMHSYDKKIKDFGNHYDLHDESKMQEYQELLQRRKMLSEEYNYRITNKTHVDKPYFDHDTGSVIDPEKGYLYSIAFNEDETDYVYNYDKTDNYINDEDCIKVKRKSRSEIYKDWNYYDDINEEL